jgi:putative flavoprotein involved in K+ transport
MARARREPTLASMNTDAQTLIIGAGQAGLALSHRLSELGHDHAVLERGEIGQRWVDQRWDSFRMLTPNWHNCLPGTGAGDDPDGFLDRAGVRRVLQRAGVASGAPVHTGVTVSGVRRGRGSWTVQTHRGFHRARTVVVASGFHDRPVVPALAADLPGQVFQLHSGDYRNPDALPPGGVLVVGSGPSGQQIAAELAAAGRSVHLAVGRHRALPRRYRGHDAWWWMRHMGLLDRTVDTLPTTGGRAPNAVLAGGRADLDLRALARLGVRPVGRLLAVDGTRVRLARDVAARLAEADAHHLRFRCAVDDVVAREGLDVPAGERPDPAPLPGGPGRLDLAEAGIGTVLWATGFRPGYRSWLHAPVLDGAGRPVHHRGVTAAPGLLFLGLPWQYRRTSHTLGGVAADADFLAEHLAARRTWLAAA